MELICEEVEQAEKKFSYTIITENFIFKNENYWRGIEKRED